MKLTALRVGVVGALALGMTLAAHATSLYNNLSAATNSGDDIGLVSPAYNSFSTGNSAVTLTAVTLDLMASKPGDGGVLAVSLWSDNSTLPGTDLPGADLETIGTIDDSELATLLADYTLTTDYALAADTRYWIEIVSSDTSAKWAWSVDISGTGVAGEYFGHQGSDWSNNPFGSYQMDVEASATPEPSTLLLVAGGLAAVTARLRRRVRG